MLGLAPKILDKDSNPLLSAYSRIFSKLLPYLIFFIRSLDVLTLFIPIEETASSDKEANSL